MTRSSRDIERAARERMRRDGGSDYDDSEPPQIDVITSDATRVSFIAHHYVYTTPWTGSDWATHYILRGHARIDGARAVDIQLEPHYVHLTEVEHDDYHRDEIVKLHIAGDAAGADAAITRMKAVTAARVQAARAGSEPAKAPEPSSRCPKCGSTDAGAKDVIFDVLVMRCNACGFEEHIDTSDHDSWSP